MGHDVYIYTANEKPFLPGGPHMPRHTLARRIGYGGAAFATEIAASLGNALVNVNGAALAGAYGANAADAGWLLAAYVAPAICATLFIVRARQQFGIEPVTQIVLLIYAGAVLMQFVAPGFASALLTRAACGLTTAGLTEYTIYNMLQIFPPLKRPIGIVLAFGILQLSVPLARLFPVELLTTGAGHGLSFIELALALGTFAVVTFHPVPQTVRARVFRPLDFLTLLLFAPAIFLVCCVLAEGRALWWTDTPWLGWALMAAIPLLVGALYIEGQRSSPLLIIRWLTARDIIRFGMVALLVRFALAEQTFGAVGLLTAGGLNNDQLRGLFMGVLLAMIAGSTMGIFLLTPDRQASAVFCAALFILTGALLDSSASNLTKPAQLYLSQSLIGFGAALFLGPVLIFGFQRMIKHGPDAFISFVVLFSMTQNIGALLGAAALGSYQTIQARRHASDLTSHLLAGDPQVAARSNLPAIIARESNVLAFNDVFLIVACLAALTALFMAYRVFLYHRQIRLQEVKS